MTNETTKTLHKYKDDSIGVGYLPLISHKFAIARHLTIRLDAYRADTDSPIFWRKL